MIHPMALFMTVPIVLLTIGFVYAIRVGSEPPPVEEAEEATDRSEWEKSRRIGYWASTISLSVVYLATGVPKLTGLSEVMHRFQEWGYSEEFMLFVGATEFLAGILLLVPRLSLYAASYLGILMAGAVYTHLAFDTAAWALLPAFCLSFLFFIAYEDWHGRTFD